MNNQQSFDIFTNFTFSFLLLAFFLQTRFAFFAHYQTVDYLIPFVYLSDVLIVLLLLRSLKSFRLLKFLKAEKRSFQFFGFLVFLSFAAISNFSAIHPVSAWYHWFKILELGLFAFWIAYFLKEKSINNPGQRPVRLWRKQLSIINLLSLGIVFQCFIAIAEFVFQRSLGLQSLGEWRFSVLTPGIAKVVLFGKEFLRPYATFPHPNVLGGILAIMAPVSLHLATTETLKKTETRKTSAPQRLQVYYLLIFLLFTITLFLTFSRSAWLAYGVLMVIVFMFWGRRGIGGIGGIGVMLGKRKLLLCLLFAACCLLFFVPIVYQRIKSLQTTDVLSVERRVELNSAAISMFWDHPLFGVGLGNFIPNLEKYLTVSGQGRFLQPVHNVPLLVLAETGVIGFLAFSTFLGVLLCNLFRRIKKEFLIFNFDFLIFLMWLGILITSLTDHYWWTLQAGQLFFWLTVGLTI